MGLNPVNNPYFHLKQVIADYIDCQIDFDVLDSPKFHKSNIYNAIELINTKIIKEIDHHFEPYGYTLIMILADSSLTLHSWPEEKFVTIEVFTCGAKSEPKKGLMFLKSVYKPSKFILNEIPRKK
ncbi:MAG: adenosylmethionine decarboxylase [Promethearchaeota archaeon]